MEAKDTHSGIILVNNRVSPYYLRVWECLRTCESGELKITKWFHEEANKSGLERGGDIVNCLFLHALHNDDLYESSILFNCLFKYFRIWFGSSQTSSLSRSVLVCLFLPPFPSVSPLHGCSAQISLSWLTVSWTSYKPGYSLCGSFHRWSKGHWAYASPENRPVNWQQFPATEIQHTYYFNFIHWGS